MGAQGDPGSGVGKSVLMGQMIKGADADVIVVGLIGERSREVSDFLATKLCGDATRMAKDVEHALHEIVQAHRGCSEAEADEYIAGLKREKRYVRDVY